MNNIHIYLERLATCSSYGVSANEPVPIAFASSKKLTDLKTAAVMEVFLREHSKEMNASDLKSLNQIRMKYQDWGKNSREWVEVFGVTNCIETLIKNIFFSIGRTCINEEAMDVVDLPRMDFLIQELQLSHAEQVLRFLQKEASVNGTPERRNFYTQLYARFFQLSLESANPVVKELLDFLNRRLNAQIRLPRDELDEDWPSPAALHEEEYVIKPEPTNKHPAMPDIKIATAGRMMAYYESIRHNLTPSDIESIASVEDGYIDLLPNILDEDRNDVMILLAFLRELKADLYTRAFRTSPKKDSAGVDEFVFRVDRARQTMLDVKKRSPGFTEKHIPSIDCLRAQVADAAAYAEEGTSFEEVITLLEYLDQLKASLTPKVSNNNQDDDGDDKVVGASSSTSVLVSVSKYALVGKAELDAYNKYQTRRSVELEGHNVLKLLVMADDAKDKDLKEECYVFTKLLLGLDNIHSGLIVESCRGLLQVGGDIKITEQGKIAIVLYSIPSEKEIQILDNLYLINKFELLLNILVASKTTLENLRTRYPKALVDNSFKII